MAKKLTNQNQTNGLSADEILSALKSMDASQIKKICTEGIKDIQKKAAKQKLEVVEDVLMSNDEMALILGSDQSTKIVIRYAFEALFNEATIILADNNRVSCAEYLKAMCAEKVKDEDARKAKRRERYGVKKSASKKSKSNVENDNTSSQNTITFDDVVHMFTSEHPEIDSATASDLIKKAYDNGHKTVDDLKASAYEMFKAN